MVFNRIVPLAIGQSAWESCIGDYTEKQEYTYKTLWTDVNKSNEIHKRKTKHKLKKDKIKKSAHSLFLNEHMDMTSLHSF